MVRAGVLVAVAAVGCADRRIGEPGHADPPTRFALPVADAAAIDGRIGVDHDPEAYTGLYRAMCTDYAGRGFPHCYDEHHGTDLILRGGFAAMDEGSLVVLAAAAGEVVEAVDGNYDRCHTSQGEVTCDGHPKVANRVVIEHPDGVRSKYFHLMKGSVSVEVGDRVVCGDPLGRIGSSGNSSMPHLHFEVELDGWWADPFAGPWSQPVSLWLDQGDADDLPGAECAVRDSG